MRLAPAACFATLRVNVRQRYYRRLAAHAADAWSPAVARAVSTASASSSSAAADTFTSVRVAETGKPSDVGQAASVTLEAESVGAVLSQDELREAVAEWWHAAAASPTLLAFVEGELDVPAFFLKHDRVREEFAKGLLVRPDAAVASFPLLLTPPAQVLGADAATALVTAELEEVARPFLRAAAAFVEEAYGRQLAAFRRARRLADLRQPQAWFPGARRLRRQWKLHLGPTNSGKTHRASQRLLSAASGVYMSPLRLLAWEMYDRMRKAGLRCALRTGQETIGPEDATHIACTVEMAPLAVRMEVAVLDEVQLITHESRGAAWTRALLGVQADEVHLCGAAEPLGLLGMLRQMALECGDDVDVKRHERLAPLVLEDRPLRGLSDVSAGDCVICFTRRDVLHVKAELEALGLTPSVVYGSLPPDVRQEQAALFNDPSSGRDVLVASDAVGMGLNLHIRRVVFHSLEKFDGDIVRRLYAPEIRQIAGRAGRFGGRYGNRGLVSCLRASDLPHVRRALEERPCASTEVANADVAVPLKVRAAIFPLAEQLDVFSRALEVDADRDLPFADIVERFVSVAQASPRYFVAEARNTVAIARALSEVRLPPGEKFVFCQAPVSARDAAALTGLHDFAQRYAEAGRVAFPVVELADPPAAVTARHILELEALHKVCDTYAWLAGRFPDAFLSLDECLATRRSLSIRISEALRQPLASDTHEAGEGPSILIGPALADEVYVS